VAVSALADTGALLAVLDRKDPWHERCVAALAGLRLPLTTSHAVLTELFHLVGDDRDGVRAAWRLVQDGLHVAPVEHEDRPALATLMDRYHDRPMDYADAMLVLLAERLRVHTVFTIDRNDFETYRIGRSRFRIVPAD
jgi:predicted nucleic acid-binding protein